MGSAGGVDLSIKVGVAVFGAGRIGSIHIQNLFLMEEADIRYILEEDITRAQKLVDKFNLHNTTQVLPVNEAEKALADPGVKAVMVCTPSFTHESIINMALNAGKAIFCEKPLAPTLEAIKSCYDRAAQLNLPIFCAFNRRFDPQLRNLHSKVMAGDIGKVRMVRSVSRDPAPMTPEYYIKDSGGIHLDSSVHDIDMVCWIVGEKPCSVFAYGHATNEVFSKHGDIDTSAVMLKFPNGAIGMIENSRYSCVGYDQRVEAFGNKGMLQSENKGSTNLVMVNESGSLSDPIYPECCARYGDSYKHEMKHFFAVLQGKEKMEVIGDSTIMVNTVALAATQSMKTGQPVILTW